MRISTRSISITIAKTFAILAVAGTFSLAAPPSTARGFSFFEDARFCSAWLSRHGDRSLPVPWLRQCLIAISETYVDALTVPGNEGVLLHPDVVRWTQQNIAEPPRNDDRDELLESIAEEDLDGEITNRRWTVDGLRGETFVIADIVLEGLPLPITLYERFLIRDGRILEIEAIYLNP